MIIEGVRTAKAVIQMPIIMKKQVRMDIWARKGEATIR